MAEGRQVRLRGQMAPEALRPAFRPVSLPDPEGTGGITSTSACHFGATPVKVCERASRGKFVLNRRIPGRSNFESPASSRRRDGSGSRVSASFRKWMIGPRCFTALGDPPARLRSRLGNPCDVHANHDGCAGGMPGGGARRVSAHLALERTCNFATAYWAGGSAFLWTT